MKEKIKELVNKAASDPTSYPDLELVYERGHDLSGITRFEIRPGGAFELSANNPKKQTSISLDGELALDQRAMLFASMADHHLLDVIPSDRNIADDELPVMVELRYQNMSFKLDVGAEESLENDDLYGFETTLWALLRQLSDNRVGRGPLRR